ncbi:hypothetical protein [Rhodoferax sp. WC2427]|uniref:hypothetical protein n=1 Tax=Rhodoferax sp. WC2427 TaxID=3234144 RepID=UPI0034674901
MRFTSICRPSLYLVALFGLASQALALNIPGNAPPKAVADQQLTVVDRTLTLPTGNWTYIAQTQWSAVNRPPSVQVHVAYAMDVQDGRMRGGVVLELPARRFPDITWKTDDCKLFNPLFSNSFGSTWKEPECLQVFKRSGHLLGLQTDFYGQAQQWVRAESVRLPGPVYEVVYAKYATNEYGRVRVFVPVQAVDDDAAMVAWAQRLPDVLRGFFEKRNERVALPALPELPAQAMAVTEPVAANSTTASGALVRIVPYASSGFAALNDVAALPNGNDNMRKIYREWLAQPMPRAFALSGEKVVYTVGTTPTDAADPADPAERALVRCRRISTTPCQLYAVDETVVWVKPTAP